MEWRDCLRFALATLGMELCQEAFSHLAGHPPRT